MNYVLVPDNQLVMPINFFQLPGRIGFERRRIPAYGTLSVPRTCRLRHGRWEQHTRSTNGRRITRTATVMQSHGRARRRLIWETWETDLTPTNWEASNGAIFSLNTNGLRMAGWTSGDAAGFPMFPALVRYDEAERGMVEHASQKRQWSKNPDITITSIGHALCRACDR